VGNNDLINMVAEAVYGKICDRAMKMVEEAFPEMDEFNRAWAEAAIAAAVTASIQTFSEAGLLNMTEG
jgi:hypothetical protein